ncbi:hypothetical protein AIGOOFII_3720 [Methylobacterium marchantiae]|nr:hypothetical protein AIGOOFII_3720 [Methylobacterium marchantiae]
MRPAPRSLPLGRHHQGGLRQLGPHTMPVMDTPDVVEELTVRHRPSALGAGTPVVIAAGGDFEHAAHETHRPDARMLIDEGERHFGISAKMPIAFFGTSRSMRVRSSSRRRRAISAAWSEGEATGLASADPCDPAARGGEEPPISAVRHGLSIEGWIPSSAAIYICGRPLLSSRATASRLNSGVTPKVRRSKLASPLGHQTPSPPVTSVSGASVKSGEDQRARSS